METLHPGIYMQEKASPGAIEAVGTSVTALLGITPRGSLDSTFISNWAEYVRSFASDLSTHKTAFMASADLSYAVYGFFLNGGTKLYVKNVRSDTAVAAKIVVPATTGVTFTMKEVGAFANATYEVEITSASSTFNVDILFNDEVVESYLGVVATASAATTTNPYYATAINEKSSFVTVGTTGTLAAGTGAMAGGVDGISDLADADWVAALDSLDSLDDLNIVAIPGIASTAVQKGLVDYCTARGDCVAVCDFPVNTTTTAAKTFRAALSGNAAIYYPWIKVVDPLSDTSILRVIPPSGHIAGIYARTDKERSVSKAPAGIEATIRGAVALETETTEALSDIMNPLGINLIMSRKNRGIVVWGARSLRPELDKRYISVVRLDINIFQSVKRGTDWAVFEPNDFKLWERLKESVSALLRTKWKDGDLVGTTTAEAFYVKCDEEINDKTARDSGRVYCEVGYAPSTPGEFIIFQFSHQTKSSS